MIIAGILKKIIEQQTLHIFYYRTMKAAIKKLLRKIQKSK